MPPLAQKPNMSSRMSSDTFDTSANVPKLDHLATELEQLHRNHLEVKKEISKAIYGQEEVIEQTLITLFAGGHGLLVGVPGVAKTRLVQTISTVLGLRSNRIQCTPDLMPADILGAEILEEDQNKKKHFRFIKGPVFCELLMADEINRASPRTQSALLQAMAESTVTIAGQNHPLPTPFSVLATQNPIEQEGTYPLPEAQLDRFMMQINVPYPTAHAEKEMLINTGINTQKGTNHKPIYNAQTLKEAQNLIQSTPIGEEVVTYILKLIQGTRKGTDTRKNISEHLRWGAGPRAGQALLLAAKVKAVFEGRFTPSIEDVNTLAVAVLQHRIMPTFHAQAQGHTATSLINTLLEA